MENNPLQPALDKMSVAPGPESEQEGVRPAAAKHDAGTDGSIAERLARDPENKEARLDRALDESMDASDPPASTQPIHNHEAPESSGYDAAEEARRAQGDADDPAHKGIVDRVLSKVGLGG